MLAYCGRLLIVDDDEDTLTFWKRALTQSGFRVDIARNLEAMKEIIAQFSFDVVLLDLQLEHENGLAGIPLLLAESPFTKVFILTSFGSIDSAVDALQKGASGYITKDKSPQKIAEELKASLTAKPIVSKSSYEHFRELGFIGQGRAFCKLCEDIEKIKDSDATVIIFGESGTGKEVIARALHAMSQRAAQRFEAINCAAIPEGLLESELFGYKKGAFTDAKLSRMGIFELCSRGTLLLDEIGDMPLTLQAKILRVLQERAVLPLGGHVSIPIQTRVIAATHRDLIEEMQSGTFREDLYYRLTVLPLHIPPLRHRKEDIPTLVSYFLEEFSQKFGKCIHPPGPEVMRRLVTYDWPGNVRELKNALERGVILAQNSQLAIDDLFTHLHNHQAFKKNLLTLSQERHDGDGLWGLPLREAKQAFEKRYVEQLLEASQGNITKAARLSGRYRSDIYRLMEKYGLHHEKSEARRI